MAGAPLRIVAVGQTPPPWGGQAVAIQSFVSGRYDRVQVFHVRMAFSRDTADIGSARPGKVLHLVALIARILWRRVRSRAPVLYYPPAGPELVPVVRDLVVLLCTRWAFRATVLHFHAAGLSEMEARLPRPLRPIFRAAYGGAELAIQTSELNPPDGRRLAARRTVVVANGVPDHPLARRAPPARGGDPPELLYVGILSEAKGLLVLVEACRRLHEHGVDFRLNLMGAFESPEFEQALHAALASAGIAARCTLLGILTGDEKAGWFGRSDVFCYPTRFGAESFGIVLVEAMQFSLPVIATRWRGVPSVVEDGVSGVLVPPGDAEQLCGALEMLLGDPGLRRRMGRRSRELYLERFTEARYRRDMEAALGALDAER